MIRLLLLLAFGAAGCSAPPAVLTEPPSLQGEWTSFDASTESVAFDEETFEIETLAVHLSISDSAWTETTVSQGSAGFLGNDFEGWEIAMTYRAEGDSVFVRNPYTPNTGRAHVAVRGDTLRLTYGGGLTGESREFVRSEPLGVPPEIVGFWAGLSEPDAAGVPAQVGFRFLPDGTYENGWGETQGSFRVFGPYLMLNGGLTSEYEGGEYPLPFEQTLRWSAEPAFDLGADQVRPALVIRGTRDDDQIVLFRFGR